MDHHYDVHLDGLMLGDAGEGPAPSSGDVPENWDSCKPGEAIDFKTGKCVAGALPPGFVTPGAVAVRPGNWDLTKDPAIYTIHAGDTYAGLAETYLGNGARYPEIWNLNRSQHPNPDRIIAGDRIKMPAEARDRFKRKTGQGGLPLWAIGVAAGALVGGYLLIKK